MAITINRDIYLTDPTHRKLVNEGVANVNDDRSSEALSVLRYELQTFVCDGQYQKGMEHILATYLKNVDQAQQPGVWISGFFGSGKSHLVKMLRALWVDTRFEDGATARGLATLPTNITDLLKELSASAKRHGGLQAASGTLGAGAAGSVRLALLRIIFKSVGLPEHYPVARFVMWLKSEEIYLDVRKYVEQIGGDWEEELDNFHVAEALREALVKAKPNLFSTPQEWGNAINNLYPNVSDVSSDDMLKAIRNALTVDGRFPLTLVVLDEVHQYIGEDSQRSLDVQEVVEACSKNFAGKLLFIGTGQTAVTGTSNLKKLEGRFTVRVELSDADVDAVIRKVVLAKKPEARAPIEQMMTTNQGEIARHLQETTVGHRQEDVQYYSQDYPILPVRRRFWENALRVLDQTGTDSQLRNQLSMIHKVIQTNVNEPIGHVVAADYLYFDSAEKLLQARILPRPVHEKTITWKNGTKEEQLMARACGLVFLINKLAGSNREIGIRATVDTIADLLVEDLSSGSTALRSELPKLLDGCELLMKVGDEYRIQTEESARWSDEFESKRHALASEAFRVENERGERIRGTFGEVVKKKSLTQGDSNEAREFSIVFDSHLPNDHTSKIYVWVRDGWSADENSVRADAAQAGNESPTVFVFIPKLSADDLRHQLIYFKAATATLDTLGVPNTPEGNEARAAMETTRRSAEGKVRELLTEAFTAARVFQGGGNEIHNNDLQAKILEAAQNSLRRLYPQFHVADNPNWAKVYEKAQKGAPDAQKAVGHEDDPTKQPVCKAIFNHVAGGKKGADIRAWFEAAPFGWSRDAIDGALQVLLVCGSLRAENERGETIDPKELERKAISKMAYRMESVNITTPQRIQIRKLYQKVGIIAKQDTEQQSAPEFLQKLLGLAERAGGEAPRPAAPDTTMIQEIRQSVGNEQLLAIYNRREELGAAIDNWTTLAERIVQRIQAWSTLKRLAAHAGALQDSDLLLAQIDHIEQHRQLLDDPDPVTPLVSNLTQIFREELNRLNLEYEQRHEAGIKRLDADANWQQLDPEQRSQLMIDQSLHLAARPTVSVGSTHNVLVTLDSISLPMFADRLAAMPTRFDRVAEGAAEMLEPEIQFIKVPRPTLKSEEEIDEWAEEIKLILKAALEAGPVAIR